jgi:hypothetical protein
VRFTRGRRAAILGCGPAGLFAAHALVQRGWSVKVFSKKRRSEMFGAQYLHRPIDGLTVSDPVEVEYRLLGGTVEEYREKIYGPNPVKTSVEALEQTHQAWDIREAYYAAWDLYEPIIENVPDISPESLGVSKWDPDASPIQPRSLIEMTRWDAVINTIPLPLLCYSDHQFQSAKVWAVGDAPERGTYAPYRAPLNTIQCSASRDVGWYRAANVFGYVTVEWPHSRKPPIPGLAEVVKPISHNCNCWHFKGSKFQAFGRYGSWTKGVLSHHAYDQAWQL